jgi:hypothetical protein
MPFASSRCGLKRHRHDVGPMADAASGFTGTTVNLTMGSVDD